MTTQNHRLIFSAVPTGVPVPGEHLKVVDRPVDLNTAPPAGALLVKNHYVSYDPYQRGRMRDPKVVSYNTPYQLGEAITNSAVSTVVKSSNPDFKEGDLVESFLSCPTEEYSILPTELVKSSVSKIDNPHGLDLWHFLHALGMPGLTAYSSIYEIASPLQAGEVIFISSAAGAVGQLVANIAKRHNLKVIGSVGSQAKLDFIIKECGFDGGFNYKEEKSSEALKRLAPDGIDIYYDNVGGEQLDAALGAMKSFGRIVACGTISGYNLKPEDAYPIRNMAFVVRKRIRIQGFVVSDPHMLNRWQKEHRQNVSKWLAEGSFKPKIDVTDGIDKAADGLVSMLTGGNFGKAILRV